MLIGELSSPGLLIHEFKMCLTNWSICTALLHLGPLSSGTGEVSSYSY
jgi:hypothetical protein